MRLELEIPDAVIDAIAAKVAATLKPALAAKTSDPPDAILTPVQLAALLDVPKGWVYEQVSLGGIPYFKTGKYLRFKRTAIEKWIESHSVPATSPLSRTLRVAK